MLKKTVTGVDDLTIALAGNPNSGKTSIFNQITGAKQHIGNWPGVTVEKKEGFLYYQDLSLNIVDLPGIYSLGAYSEEEIITKRFLLSDKVDVVINVLDSTNLERNLYLTTQLIEMDVKIVLVLNMYDEINKKNFEIDIEKLEDILGIPVVKTVGSKGKGINDLICRVVQTYQKDIKSHFKINYGTYIKEKLDIIKKILDNNSDINKYYDTSWIAIKILEQDESIIAEVENKLTDYSLVQIKNHLHEIENRMGEETDVIIAEKKYGYIHSIVREVVSKPVTIGERLSVSDKIDKVVTDRYLGLPVFLLIMWGMFKITFTLGNPMRYLVENFFGFISEIIDKCLLAVGAPDLIISLFINGIIEGVCSVLVFIPNIFLLFLCISILEDSGYMARAAYVMDKIMQKFGLHGKSFIPLIIGFGCNVPGVMATRTLENKDDRLITILINNFMSCSARLPVYVLFSGIFFPGNEENIIFSLYLLGIIISIIMAKIFRKFLFKEKTGSFIMELPPYRKPNIQNTLIHMWERGSIFIRKAGTVILSVVILIWVLANLPAGVDYASQQSLIGRIGKLLSPAFLPLGLGNWQITASLLFGILAKEVIIGTLGVVYNVGEAGLAAIIANNFTPLSAYTLMVVTLLYTPCIATLSIIKKETSSWWWTIFAALYIFIVAWVVAFVVYQGGLFLQKFNIFV